MIRNIVFDMGRVMIDYEVRVFYERFGIEQSDRRLLTEEIFTSIEWIQMDRGLLDEEDALEIWRRRLPKRLHEQMRKMVLCWNEPIMPIEGMAQLVKELKENGYNIYLLSNATRRQHEYWPDIPGNEYFDDTLISADVKLVKPQPEIFEAAYRKFGIQPEESLFVDDNQANAEASCLTGMKAFVFRKDVMALRNWLRQQGVRI